MVSLCVFRAPVFQLPIRIRYKKVALKSKIVDDILHTRKVRLKQTENNELALKETEFQALKLANGVINQTEYDAAIDAIKDATRIKKMMQHELSKRRKKES
jgi:hypothetical protein